MENDEKDADAIAGSAGTCGTCAHGVRRDIQAVECYGAPPSVAVVGANRLATGQTQFMIEKFRPMMTPAERGCALYKFKFGQDTNFGGAAPIMLNKKKPDEPAN
jgi:hypothetical protein